MAQTKESRLQCGRPGDWGSIPGLGRAPGEGKGYPLQYSGLKNSMDCIVHEVTKSWTRLNDFWDFPSSSVGKESVCTAGDTGSVPSREDPLEKEMATHSSILAWRILWREEPSGLQSIGSHRVGHN